MKLLILIVYVFTCYGISNMVVYSDGPFNVFSNFRKLMFKINNNLGELFSCMMCFPMWVGIIFSLIDIFLFTSFNLTPFNIILHNQASGVCIYFFVVLMDGAFASGMTWLIHTIQEYFENKSNIE